MSDVQKKRPHAPPATVAGGVRNGGARLNLDRSATTKRTSLTLSPGMSIDAWRHLGQQILVISDSSAWWLGDWLVYGEKEYPDRYKRAIEGTSLDYQTLRNYAWVVRKFTPERRWDRLSFQHHAEVAGLAPAEQDRWLARAAEGKWSRNELRRRIREHRLATTREPQVAHVRINIVSERKGHWQKAAQSAEQDLSEWIVEILDAAAQTALDAPEEEAAV